MTKRDIAHIIIEADTPLKIGSNKSDFLQDSPIQRDWNNLPMILGTSIAGVLRKDFNGNKDDVFGSDSGSKIIFSNALLVDEKGKVHEKLLLQKTPFLQHFEDLPIREHAAINSQGAAKKMSKYDEEVVFKGSRFKFSIESLEDNETIFKDILALLSAPNFRLGGGSTKGFGKFKIHEIKIASLMSDEYTSTLDQDIGKDYSADFKKEEKHSIYTLKLKPDDFFMFGSGFGDNDTDMTPVFEKVIDYKNKGLSDRLILIPASSIKGALSHRTTYHYNKLKGNTIEAKNGLETIVEIFGEAKNSKKNITGSKGKLLLCDCFKSFDERKETKVFDHVSIDRFTGGAINGALFQEKTVATTQEVYEIEILLETSLKNTEFESAFELALRDISTGMLPLGGATTKGHGVFSGTVLKDGVKL